MSTPYEQLSSTRNTDPMLPYMRLPCYSSLRSQRYHPYATTRVRLLPNRTDMMDFAEGVESEVDIFPDRADLNPVSFSWPMILEDDCMASLRTVVSQIIGQDATPTRLGAIHLVIDFALIVRSYRRKGAAVVRNEPAM